jgi:hypothetical protein
MLIRLFVNTRDGAVGGGLAELGGQRAEGPHAEHASEERGRS